MKKSVMLKNCRTMERRVSQKELSEAVGISERMINKLEHDEDLWKTMRSSHREKLNEYFKNTRGWEPLEVVAGSFDPDKLIKKESVEIVKEEPKIIENKINQLTENDVKALTLIEFAYEGLSESGSHAEFMANINMLKRILKKFDF